ncbi:hypothetical protein [Novosphingobium sp. Gsoil 351]|uniref:hypothetical protein n=1 Tax=Novosphingobium sp. Gsoil 351 TaxID=2675225 RepID=UPI0012B4BA89|nr:hypothetical protein [Novosphingobium sp. Gsoil 351]QGN54396.1 hypothetical protein GKE62_07325 [Novosphingobium sp. Gsoil 351]
MTRKFDRTQIADVARIVAHEAAAPRAVAHPARTFEMPPRLYALTAAAYLSFVAVLATAFATRELILPIAVIAILIGAGFGVPALWARMRPETKGRAMGWSEFRNRGIMTYTGRMNAADATTQVLVLPTLILLWAVAVATIAAFT